ncbi:E3 ubiquitin-protein ligase TRIM33-like [Dreissena polymorpha]|uniref:E3 ubiquitin-protein ligase TRIM33-like n=1 Tax=Dreissena polymorpha TaxID=45954 RepID=UPI002264121A|nr:E3 ubiquitin-protein ligase TRIM33-like [Dreissena polymorpha]
MASNMDSSINKGSDLVIEFSCFSCQENGSNIEAEFYCLECSTFYCSKCVEHHNVLNKKHAILGKEYISQWPESNVGDLEQCQQHRKEKLTGFCEDHSELICHACRINNHQKCSDVVFIADKVKDLHQNADFNKLSAIVDEQNWRLMYKIVGFGENMKSLEKSYETILGEINAFRKHTNHSLKKLEKNTKDELAT